ncbi:MAG: ABC transporter ATP-binding protein [Candidatus Sumerlaeia bacterium]|nr:ABC transporter ATP-binding protein [Candidatus Sumerlaeia bacterium]
MTVNAPTSTTPQPLVSARGLNKSFGSGEARVHVLKDIDVEIRKGEMTFLIGPSGCGKTTLISILGAILHPDSGEVKFREDSLFSLRERRLAAHRLRHFGFIFQQFNLLNALTITENAAIPLIAQGEQSPTATRRARELLCQLGLEKQLNNYPAQLSGGQQQRVAIARAIIHEPALLICDEPTASLDAATGRQVMEILRSSAMNPERAVIVVTHDNRIYEFADRIISMADGRIESIKDTSSPGKDT